ncbi:RidA family protein [Balneola vulgaris]|uniref:RidA family protein n=1 Tax=Balneola vulgaris TaxID=287535 RepID=UPI0012FB9C91|nr:Rid family detoxifying hydrolase [Balneola vulgaris]
MKHLTTLLLLPILILSCTHSDVEVMKHSENYSMERKVIQVEGRPASPLYSQAIQVGNHIFVSGQVGYDIEKQALAGDDLASQTHQTIKNIQSILNAAGYELSDVVEAQVFLDDMDNYSAFNDIYVTYFPENPPARAVVEVSALPINAKVEIKLSAVK